MDQALEALQKDKVSYEKKLFKAKLLDHYESTLTESNIHKRTRSVKIIKKKTHHSVDNQTKERFLTINTGNDFSYFKGCID